MFAHPDSVCVRRVCVRQCEQVRLTASFQSILPHLLPVVADALLLLPALLYRVASCCSTRVPRMSAGDDEQEEETGQCAD